MQIPGGNGQQMSREMDSIQSQSRAVGMGGIDPSQMSPQQIHAQLWRILKFRDDICKSIEVGIEKVPGLSSLLERITDS